MIQAAWRSRRRCFVGQHDLNSHQSRADRPSDEIQTPAGARCAPRLSNRALSKENSPMIKLRLVALTASALICSASYAQHDDFATGNMHFNAKDMDTNGDHMVTREEMQKYAQKMWDAMSHGKDTIPTGVATKDFASAGLNFRAREIDTDNDGSISKEEFLVYTLKRYDGMKKTGGMVPVDDMATA